MRWTLNAVLFAVACLGAAVALPLSPGWSVTRPSLTAARESSGADRQVILDRNLFGFSALEPTPSLVQQTSLGKAQMPLTLFGTFAANEPSLSQATLRDDENEQTLVVGVGDLIENQALVMRIERERVVLRENGLLRELTLEGASGRRDEEQFAVSSTADEHAILNSTFGGIYVVPVFEEAQMVGLQFSLVQYGSQFEEIGLENGDVVTEFNGTPIDSPAKSAQLLQELSEADAVYVVGYRPDGSEKVWDYVRGDG
jgi:general secretion pathway protein C